MTIDGRWPRLHCVFDVGVTLGDRYLLESLVARGGMGEVWRARDIVLDRRVAVKVLLPNFAGDPGFTARFRAEARAMAALSHPGIIEIYDYGQADGLAYLVMQFVEGESLVSLIRRAGPLAPERAMRLVIQAAEAIEEAHRQGIVHRDVKPANLLLRADGRLALTDFGIARILATDRLTGADQIVGTSSYLAPEQVTGEEIGPATDVYALGVVAFELLAGAKPFAADTSFGVALMHVHEAPPPLPAEVPQPIRELVLRAMAKDPAERWPSAAALAQAASAAIGEPATVRPAGALPEPKPRRAKTGGPTGGLTGRATGGQTGEPSGGPAGRATGGQTGEPSGGSAGGPTGGPAREPAGESTGDTTRTTRRSKEGTETWEEPPAAPKRLLLAGGAVAVLTAAAILIVAFSPNGAGSPQSESPGGSPSAAASSSTGPTQTNGEVAGTPSARTSGGTGTTPPASPLRTSPGTGTGGGTGQSSPPPTTATVPNMYGWRETEVVSEIRRLGLVERITYRFTPDQCYAIEQTPSGGTVVATGSTVSIVIAKPTGICKEV